MTIRFLGNDAKMLLIISKEKLSRPFRAKDLKRLQVVAMPLPILFNPFGVFNEA